MRHAGLVMEISSWAEQICRFLLVFSVNNQVCNANFQVRGAGLQLCSANLHVMSSNLQVYCANFLDM